MKTYKAKNSPFYERPYYTTDEIEKICIDELYKVDLFPSSPKSIRIERFIEKRYNITPIYRNLPSGAIGYTKFGKDGPMEIGIARQLEESRDKVSERRINTTLAHEIGHCLLHSHLFVLYEQGLSLFQDSKNDDPFKILCRSDSILGNKNSGSRYDGKWWEFQANQAIGALLLPKKLVIECLKTVTEKQGSMNIETLENDKRIFAEKELSEVFDVNPIVARIRLDAIYPRNDSKQLTL